MRIATSIICSVLSVDFCLDYKIISINKTYLSDNVVSDI